MTSPGSSLVRLERPDGDSVPLADHCSLGRSADNTVVLRNERVSRRHALIHMQGADEWWLVDLGSSNGTYINRVRVHQPQRLRDGDQIGVGPFTLVFRQSASLLGSEPGLSTEHTAIDLRASPCWLLVADVMGSTDLAHRMADQEIAMLMGRWFSACQEILERHGGIVNKYLGDGFFAYWPGAESARAGLLAAWVALRALQDQATPPFRLVLHHGQIVMGGGASLGEESLSGREVNFVFRMEKLAAQLKLARLVSDPARQLLGDSFPATEAGLHLLPGFPDPVTFHTC